MRLVEQADVISFLSSASPVMAAAEPENSLVWGIAQTLRDRPGQYPGGAWMATIEDEDFTIGAALRTPPHVLILTRIPSEAVSLLAQWHHQDLPGVVGPRETAEEFARLWSSRKGTSSRLGMSQRMYQLNRVEPTPRVPGRARRAGANDAEDLLDWRRAYEAELRTDGPLEEACRRFRAEVEAGNAWLWEDGPRVCMAVCVGSTPKGIRIGGVYTPPELRRRGYAAALVAEVSRIKLAEGKAFCSLVTDLANPTSNAIYQRIGYRAVCDFAEYRFG
jgi:predicted GNAT family acetyltransferase